MEDKEFRVPREKDLTNRIFGKLKAIRPTQDRDHNYVVWECICECGNTHYVRSGNLLIGSVQSCGCQGKGKWKALDLTGKKFGLLTAMEPTGEKDKKSNIWECYCDCGNIAYFSARDLKQKGKKSCGCLDTSGITDLTGEKFGMLTVIEKTEKREHNTVVWKCKCDCGNETFVTSRDLIHHRKMSCGCGNKSKKDLTGQKFGLLTAIEPTNERDGSNVVWKCKCDCGNETFASTTALTSGGKKSCGCLLKATRRNLSGQTFGKLTVLEATDERQSGSVVWLCRCDCGNTARVSSRRLTQGAITSCGCDKKK